MSTTHLYGSLGTNLCFFCLGVFPNPLLFSSVLVLPQAKRQSAQCSLPPGRGLEEGNSWCLPHTFVLAFVIKCWRARVWDVECHHGESVGLPLTVLERESLPSIHLVEGWVTRSEEEISGYRREVILAIPPRCMHAGDQETPQENGLLGKQGPRQ